MSLEISLIIPSHNDETGLEQLFQSLYTWEALPNEIVIVDSSIYKPNIDKDFYYFLKKHNINFKLIQKKISFQVMRVILELLIQPTLF